MSGAVDRAGTARNSRDTRRHPAAVAFVILGLIAGSIAGVFAFQAAGYPPCELCLKERWPFYAGIALSALAVAAAYVSPVAVRAAFITIALLFLCSTIFGAYHAGVEWGMWPGPTDCTGTAAHATTNADFLQQLKTVRVVRCDAAALRILGLSLAGWNAVVSLAIALLAVFGVSRASRV